MFLCKVKQPSFKKKRLQRENKQFKHKQKKRQNKKMRRYERAVLVQALGILTVYLHPY